MTRTNTTAPAPLIVAAGLVLVEAVVLVALGVVEVASFDTGRVELGITTSLLFFGYAAGLGWCAWSITRGRSWARAPIMLTQLIQIGVATSFWGGDTKLVTVALVIVAVVVLAGVLHPASIEHLAEEPS